MDASSSAAGIAVQSLLTLLAENGSRHAALSLMHQRALQTTGGTASLLFEPHPTTRHLHATSGAGVRQLPTAPWDPADAEGGIISRTLSDRSLRALPTLADEMPQLHRQLETSAALLLPLLAATRKVGLLAIGITAEPHQAAAALSRSEVPGGFALALELSRLRQREEFEDDVRELLDRFAHQLGSTLDLRAALEPVCARAARLFAADRMTVWLHDRDSRALHPLASSDSVVASLEVPVRADDPLIPAAAALRNTRAGLASNHTEVTATLTVPLRGYRRALGTLVFEGVRIEPGDDLALLNRADELGRRMSSAIEISQLVGVVTAMRQNGADATS